jgi:predicted phage terminase large subunit-like protein
MLTHSGPKRFVSPIVRMVDALNEQVDTTADGDGENPRGGIIPFTRSVFMGDYQTAGHHMRIAEALDWAENTPGAVLIVVMPPRHGKSTLISEHWPPYLLGKHPDWRIIETSATQELANDFSQRARDIISSNKWPFPRVKLRHGQSRIQHWNIEQDTQNLRGGYSAVGAAGQLTGRGANVLVIDDPVKNYEDAVSPRMRRKNWEWFTGTAFPRLEPGGRLVVVGTRWHEDDLIGRLIKFAQANPRMSRSLRVLHMPAIDRMGNALWPERFPIAELHRIREMVGAFNWRAQYQGDPDEESGNVLDPAWIGIDTTRVQESFDWYLQSWDTSFGEGDDPDYSACITFAVSPEQARIVDVWRGIVKFPQLLDMIERKAEQFGPRTILVENKVSGISARQYLKRHRPKLPIVGVPVPPGEGKVKRAHDIVPYMMGGKSTISADVALYSDFIAELRRFPNDRYDDQVDAYTQGMGHLYLPQNERGGRARSRNYRERGDDFDEQLEETRRGR